MSWFKIKKIQAEVQQKRALPTGVKEFHSWADRIIQGAGITATVESQKYTLANVLVNSCGPAVAFESDLFFINYLRKSAVNQIAVAMRDEIYASVKARKEAEQNQSAASAPEGENGKVLEIR